MAKTTNKKKVEMNELIKQIEDAIDQNLYLIALSSCLTLPDICGAINTRKGIANGQNYRKWYDVYVLPDYDALTSDECYNFRCKFLHQGQTRANKKTSYYSHIAFAEPKPKGQGAISVNIKQTSINGEAGPKSIDVLEFMNAIIAGVKKWMSEKTGDIHYEKNMSDAVQRREDGIPGIIGGITYIY